MNKFWRNHVAAAVFFAMGFTAEYLKFAARVFFASEGDYLGFPHRYWSWYPSGQLMFFLFCGAGFFLAQVTVYRRLEIARWRDLLWPCAVVASIPVALADSDFLVSFSSLMGTGAAYGYARAAAFSILGLVAGYIAAVLIYLVTRERRRVTRP